MTRRRDVLGATAGAPAAAFGVRPVAGISDAARHEDRARLFGRA